VRFTLITAWMAGFHPTSPFDGVVSVVAKGANLVIRRGGT
jgi:hypothetical protein